MIDDNSNVFIEALEKNDVDLMKKIPKAEFHNHSALGCDRKLLIKYGVHIPKFEKINSIKEMDIFSKKYVSKFTKTEEGFKFLIEDTVISAINDGIVILETSIDFRFFKFYSNNIEQGLIFLENLKNKYQDRISLKYDIGLSRKSYNIQFENLIIKLIDSRMFSGIDIYGDEAYNDLSKFKNIYKYAKNMGMKLKAHVGEFGDTKDIINTIKYLDINVVQHGINIAYSKEDIIYAKERGIVFNVCPTSNIVLKRAKSLNEHPIRLMYDMGLKITINTDDLLIFNSTLSDEYLKLYSSKVFNAKELNEIRIKSLNY